MKVTGCCEIAADPQAVWAAILDPEVLRACVPGCESVTGTPEDGFTAVVVQKVGPVRATYRGAVAVVAMDPPRTLRINGAGKGFIGSATGAADLTLTASSGGTQLDYEVEAHIGGRLEQFGARIIEAFAQKMADGFFTRLKAAVDGVPVKPAPRKGWLRRASD